MGGGQCFSPHENTYFRRSASTGILWRHQNQRWPGLTGSPCYSRLTHNPHNPKHWTVDPFIKHWTPPPQEIQRHEPDVICLEEVCCTFFTSIPPSICARSSWTYNNPWLLPRWSSFPQVDCFSQLSSQLDGAGFAGVWVPKPSSPCLKFKVGTSMITCRCTQLQGVFLTGAPPKSSSTKKLI